MILSVKQLKFSYPSREVLKDIDFTVQEGDCVGILGTNGTGKSTLLKCLDRILKPKGGTVYIQGEDLRHISSNMLAQKIAYVAQKQNHLRNRVFDSVLLGRKPYIKWDADEKDYKIVEDILSALDLSEYAMRYTDELSGGELQKITIARALAQEPKVLLMDEPTSNLDIKNQLDTIAVIEEIVNINKVSVIVAMHDINLALRFVNKFLLMKNGEIFAAGDKEIINKENIRQVYGVNVMIHDQNGIPFIIPQ